jgi:hypothetical protein
MQTSEEQFRELLAHLVARANKALAQDVPVPPMSFALSEDGGVHFSVGVSNSPSELKQILKAMQESLAVRVNTEPVLATCVAYTESETAALVALLENRENYCVSFKIPGLPGSNLDMDNMQIEDGFVCVFPVVSDS